MVRSGRRWGAAPAEDWIRSAQNTLRGFIRNVASISWVWIIFLGGNLNAAQITFAQEIRARAQVDSSDYLIGDWINLTMEVEHPEGYAIAWPPIADSLKPLEIIQQSQPTVTQSAQGILERTSVTLVAYDSGMFMIPILRIPYTRAGDTVRHFVETPSLPVVVHGIAVDTTGDIKDIKPPLSVPVSLAEILPYIIGAAGLGGLAWLLYRILKKRRKGESIIPAAPPRPADEVALAALSTLESERLWQRGKFKEYHSQLTDILRTYVEGRFGVMALEMTTEEILASPVIRELNRAIHEQLREILVRADLVKFAKFNPLPEEHERSLSLALTVVQSTGQRHLSATPEASAQTITGVTA